jgi:hypothetical protein
VDGDAEVSTFDLTQFAESYINGEWRADVNRDGSVDAADIQLFTMSYDCVCNP